MNSNPALGLIGFWMMLQLAATIAILLGGIYALYCLGRASAGLDRMASAMEEWVAQQRAASTPAAPANTNSMPLSQRIEQAPVVSAPSTLPANAAQPFAPSVTHNSPVSSPANPSAHEPTS